VKARSAVALAFGIVLIGAVAAYVAANRSKGAVEAEAGDPPVPVEAGEVSLKDVPITINALGTVTPIETVAVQSRVNGQIMKAFFHQGQPVKEGDPLFLIDPRPYQAALDLAQAQLAHDQAVLKEAQTDLTRYQTLVAENSIAAQKAADQAFAVQQDEGTVKLDEANVETAQLNLTYAHIDSPATGVAGVMQVDPGNYVQAGAGTGLVNITQIQPIFVSFPIPQSNLEEVRDAQAKGALDVQALSQGGKKLDDGKLTFINNQVAAATGTVTLYATFPNEKETLWPGEFVNVDLMVGVRKSALTAPVGSVMSGPNGDYVYTISPDNVAHNVPVVVAARQNGLAVFTKGVASGDRVVVNGQYNLADGVKVAIEPPKATASAAK
jgi:membrane fusion protein, multidrug efflux system